MESIRTKKALNVTKDDERHRQGVLLRTTVPDRCDNEIATMSGLYFPKDPSVSINLFQGVKGTKVLVN